jgi:hypothetical protein
MLRVLLKIPLPALAVPRVLGTGDLAPRRGSVYATVLIDAETGRRVYAVEGRHGYRGEVAAGPPTTCSGRPGSSPLGPFARTASAISIMYVSCNSALGHSIHVSDLRLFARKIRRSGKFAGHGHTGPSLSRTRAHWA